MGTGLDWEWGQGYTDLYWVRLVCAGSRVWVGLVCTCIESDWAILVWRLGQTDVY